MTLLAALAGLWWVALVCLLLGSTLLALLQPALAARRAVAGERRPVSVLVPLRQVEEAESEANQALLRLDHPGLEILFSVSDAEPSRRSGEGGVAKQRRMGCGPLPVSYPDEAVQADHTPSDPTSSGHLPHFVEKALTISVHVTTPIPGANPKIANLIEPVEAAEHDLLLIKDAATILPPGALAAMMTSLTPGVGLVSCVPVARRPGNFPALVEASLVNSYGGRLLLALSALGGGAGIGAAMLLRRGDLEAAGGISTILRAVADDHALAKLLQAKGLRPVFAAATVDQDLGARRPGEIWQRHLRWAICRRLEEPLAFAAEPLTGLPAACLAALAGAALFGLPAIPLLALTILLWPAAECVLAWRKSWPLSPAMPLAVLAREALMPVLWLNALAARRLAWGTATIALSGRH
ncbi:glycosyltransferase [Labrys portucalensis]|uniref:Glycosyltransferase n=1 Tax=Labrys neptuniae TaxID=376174 RepID=A0ABV6ZME0_9HYPH